MFRPYAVSILVICAALAMLVAGCSKSPSPSGSAPISASVEDAASDGEAASTPEADIGTPEVPATSEDDSGPDPSAETGQTDEEPGEEEAAGVAKQLPRVVDLGRGTCIPCRRMAPILDELKRELKGKAVVEVIDLDDDPEASDVYKIRLIPSQIFFDTEGNETWRHEGFLGKEDILTRLKEAGMKE